MKNSLWNNWQAKLISFLLALVIWAYVKNQVEGGLFFDQIIHGNYTPEK